MKYSLLCTKIGLCRQYLFARPHIYIYITKYT